MHRTSKTVLTICRTCRPEGCAPDEPPLGAVLGRRAAKILRRGMVNEILEIRTIACLSACSRACSAAVAAPDKFAYVIGGLAPEDAEDLVVFAALHADSADGVPPWRARPEKIRKNTVSRVPPPGLEHALVEEILEADAVEGEASP